MENQCNANANFSSRSQLCFQQCLRRGLGHQGSLLGQQHRGEGDLLLTILTWKNTILTWRKMILTERHLNLIWRSTIFREELIWRNNLLLQKFDSPAFISVFIKRFYFSVRQISNATVPPDAGPVEPVSLRAVHPHRDLPVRDAGGTLSAGLQVATNFRKSSLLNPQSS